MIITISKRGIKKKMAERPKKYIKELQAIAISTDADGSMSFNTKDIRWISLHKKYETKKRNEIKADIHKKKSSSKIIVSKAKKKRDCNCHGKKRRA